MATIVDVAQLAKVSIASVSRYLNSPEMLRPEKPERNRAGIEELEFQPSRLAVSMRTNKTNTIALIIPSLTNLCYIDIYGALRDRLLKRGYTVNLYTTERDEDELRRSLDSLHQHHYDGVVIAYLDEIGVRRMLEQMEREIPMVLITSDPSQENISNVFLDARDAIFKATRHLLDIGCQRIGYVGGAPNSIIAVEKYQGFSSAMRQAGMDTENCPIYYGRKQHFSSGINAINDFLRRGPLPDGIVCETDDVGIGCIKQLKHHKIAIPREVAVSSMNNISIIQSYEPELTTVAPPLEEMIETTTDLLLTLIQNRQAPRTRVPFQGRLIVRNSTVE